MKTNRKLWLPLLLGAVVVLSACGGGGGDGVDPAGVDVATPAQPDIGQGVSALLDFMRSLIAGTSETSDPIDINPLTLAVDDTADASPL